MLTGNECHDVLLAIQAIERRLWHLQGNVDNGIEYTTRKIHDIRTDLQKLANHLQERIPDLLTESSTEE